VLGKAAGNGGPAGDVEEQRRKNCGGERAVSQVIAAKGSGANLGHPGLRIGF